MPKIKKLIAVITVLTGALFTGFSLLTVWRIYPKIFDWGDVSDKLLPTLAILTVAGIALLGIMKMVEDKANRNQ